MSVNEKVNGKEIIIKQVETKQGAGYSIFVQ
jgi:hypothetical protein